MVKIGTKDLTQIIFTDSTDQSGIPTSVSEMA
jgi:hypothetical protein